MAEDKQADEKPKVKSTMHICVQYQGKSYYLDTIRISGDDIYIWNSNDSHSYSEREFTVNQSASRATIEYDDIPTEASVAKRAPFRSHISVHGFQRIHTKSNDSQFSPRRGYTTLLDGPGVVDFYIHIPKNPLKNELSKKKIRDNCIILRLPPTFNDQAHGLEIKLGIAKKNMTLEYQTEYGAANQQGLKIDLPYFDLYLSYRIIGTGHKGLQATITEA